MGMRTRQLWDKFCVWLPKKLQKAIALALPVLMVLTMLPVSVSAAADTHDHTATGTSGTISIKLTALPAKDFGHTYTRTSGNPLTQEVTNTRTYNSLLRPFFAPSASSDTSTLDGYIAEASAVYDTTKAQKELTVGQDDIFLVAAQVKLDEANKEDYKGIILYNLALKYDPTKLEYIGKSDTDWPASINMAMIRGVNLDTENDPPAPDSELMGYYTSGLSAQTNGEVLTAADGTAYIQVGVRNGNPNYLPKNQPWDILFPFKAKDKTADDAPATIEVETQIYTIGVEQTEGMFRIGKDSNDVLNADSGLDWTTGQGEGRELSIGGELGPAHLSTSNVAINVKNFSQGPGSDPTDYSAGIENKKNYPYVTTSAADSMDTLTFPTDENGDTTGETPEKGFVVGDTVIFYAAEKQEDGSFVKGAELGRTLLTGKGSAAGGTTGVFKDEGTELEDGTPVEGKTVYLLGYDSANDTWKQNPGYGYLKGESKVFLARLETGKDPSEAIGPIDIDPEDPVYYTGNTSYVLGNNPGAKEDNPIKIKLGDTVADVLAQITATDPDMNAPYENALGNTVSPALKAAWGDAALYDGSLGFTQDGVDAATGEYCKHGKFLLVNPYKSTTATMPDGTTVTVRQPSVYYTTPSQIPAAGYGQAIYVQVDPNPADYYLANPAPEDNFLYVVGKTKQYMTVGDRIRLYTTGASSSLIASLSFTGTDVTNGLYKGLDLNNHSEITAGGKVLLTYTNAPVSNDKESEKVEIPVTDGKTAIVASDVEVTDADGTEFNISPNTNWERFVKYIGSATFTVNGPPAADNTLPSQELVLSKDQILEWTNKDTAAQARLNVTETTTKYNDNDALKTALLNASDTNTLTKETAFEASFVIPTSTELKASLPNGDPYDGEYANPAAYSVKAAAAVRRTIHISGKELSVSVKENKPLGDDYKDTIEISGDELGELNSVFTSLQTGGTRPADLTNFEIVLYDAVTGQEVGSASDPADFKEAKVVHADGEADTYTYTLYVNQTARDIGTKLELYTVNPQGGNAYIAEFEVGVQEEYALMGVDAPAPEKIQLLKDDILTFLGSAVTDPDTYTITKDDILNYLAAANAEDSSVTNAAALGLTGPQRRFGYYMSVKELNELNQTVTKIKVDPSATYTEEVDTPYDTAKWQASGTDFVSDYVTLTFQNGTNNENILKPDAADRKNAGSTLPINADSRSNLTPVTWQVKVVEGQYTNEPVDPASLASTAVIQNNPYPQDDVLKLNITKEDGKDYTGLVAEVYVDNVHVGKVDIENAAAGEVAVTLDTGKDPKTLLNSMGGKVSVRLHTDGLALSDPASANYGAEDYVLWSVAEVDPTTVGVQYQDIQADVLAGVKAKLPKTLTATAVHLGPASGAVGVEPRTGAEESITVTLPVQNWLKAGDVITAADFADAASLTGSDSNTYTLNADYNVTAAAAKTALITNANGTAQDVALIDPATLTGVTAPTGYNVSDPLDLQIGGTAFEHVKTKMTPNTGVVVTKGPKQSTTASDHEVKVYVPVDEATALTDFVPGSTHAILKYQDASGAVRFFVSNDTLTVQETVKIGEVDTNCYVITVNTVAASLAGFTDPEDTTINYEAFQGLNLSGGQVEACLIEIGKNKSDSVTGTYDKADAAIPLTDDIMIANVHLTAGSLNTNQQVLDLAPYTQAKTTLNNQEVTIPLVSDGASTPKVSWKLMYSDSGEPGGANAREIPASVTTGEGEGAVTDNNNWATVLSTVPVTGGYYLVAELDVANARSGGNPISITNSGNKVAFVKLSLYTNYDPGDPDNKDAMPLVLTEGNSALWTEGNLATMHDDVQNIDFEPAAHKALARRAAGTEEGSANYKDYRTDAIFFYFRDSYMDTTPLVGSVSTVKTYVDIGTSIEKVRLEDGTELSDFSTWTNPTADEAKNVQVWTDSATGRTLKVEQLNEDGSEIAIQKYDESDQKLEGETLNYIEPRNSKDMANYFVAQQVDSAQRFIENYIIRYTLTDGQDVYQMERKVKLKFVPGDSNGDGRVTSQDVSRTTVHGVGGLSPFIASDAAKQANPGLEVMIAAMNVGACDFNGDGRGTSLDVAPLTRYGVGGSALPNFRW